MKAYLFAPALLLKMQRKVIAFTALCIIFVGCQSSHPVDPNITLVFQHATIIDGNGSEPISDGTIAIAGDRIVYAGSSADAPGAPNAEILDMNNRWIVPGFIDMHAHLDGGQYAPTFLARLVAFGTTVARAPSNPNFELRNKITSGELIGPQLFLSGVLINGPDAYYGQRGKSENDYREIVARDAALGVDFVKIYAGVSPELARVVIDESHKHGLKVIGHLGATSWTEAAEAGIDSLAHSWYAGMIHSVVPETYIEEFRGFYIPAGPPGFNAGLFQKWRQVVDTDGPEVFELAGLLVRQGIDIDPNLVLGEAVTWGDDPRVLERLEPDYAMPGEAESWRGKLHPYSSSWSNEEFKEAKLAWPKMLEIIRVFHERGVLLTAGTDYLNPWMTPGVAFHRELELLVSAGIPPIEVLSIATRNGARALDIIEETGTIEAGKRADLVILTADPLESISNTRKIERVILQGRILDPAQLLEVTPRKEKRGV